MFSYFLWPCFLECLERKTLYTSKINTIAHTERLTEPMIKPRLKSLGNAIKLMCLTALALITACQPDTTQEDTSEIISDVTLQEIITKELGSGVVNNDIFLDFQFGMSRGQVKAKVESMVKSGKLKVKKGKIIYQLDVNDEAKDVLISPFYDENGLYELGLTVHDAHYEAISNIFLTKYANCEIYRSKDTINQTDALYLIKGNRQIKVSSGDEVKVFYTNLTVQQKLGIGEGEKKGKKVKSKSTGDL